MKKEITYKDLLIKILEGKEVPKKVIYDNVSYDYCKAQKEYIYKDNFSFDGKYLSSVIGEGSTILAFDNIKIKYIVDILDQQEKDYLKTLIKPFRNKVKSICKYEGFRGEYISIGLYNDGNINLPYFKPDTMYKNMIINKEYTIEELGLWLP